ncbi:hypothetical protein EYB26_008462 [Talaromyces marneffei]|uniref:uncharacterized protein n=1 Tax=Talaromyces marneffei TaxID=37727 RepID=UPI0012A9C354|nr:uncharacterized protein EYB26_008462 [Talaromyces marneffei]QGA20754.1 hypothetical protein EYB26_008462 [Talaromyces marneffei]
MSDLSCPDCRDKSPDILVGWVLENSGRGTLSLITTCMITIFLCTWVSIHQRVYTRQLFATSHKFALFFKGILAPEFIAVEGFQEWAQCRKMKRDCAKFTNGRFQLFYGFYISMLALRYRTPRGNKVIWPNQYTWLLQQNLINWDNQASWGLSIEDIRDKAKTDSLAKFIALVQVSWFVAQSIIRAAHALPISQLESMTLGYMPLFIVTCFFWWNKPQDIRSPSIVELPEMSSEQQQVFDSMAVSNKFDDEGLETQVTLWNIWYLTPRVFEKEEEDRAIQEALSKSVHTPQESKRNLRRQFSYEIPFNGRHDLDLEDIKFAIRKEVVLARWDPELYTSKIWPLICLFGVCFGAIHLVSWNTVFPTVIEMWLWRVSAFVSIGSMIIFMHFEKVVLRWDGLVTIISLTSVGLYFLSRILMMAEVFAALRAEDPSIYDTVQVSTYWVHSL